MSIPMEMKKIAEKMSRTGAMVVLSTSEYSVSPSTVPMMNAPTAAEMCSCCPTRASPKHIARLTTSITSLDLKRATNLMMRGAISAPMNRAHTKKRPSRTMRVRTSPRFAVPEVATPERTLSRMTAAKSSTTSTPYNQGAMPFAQQPGVAQHLYDDGGAADRERRAEEYRLCGAPAEKGRHLVAERNHEENLDRADEDYAQSHLTDAPPSELQPDGEQEHYEAEFGHQVDALSVGDGRWQVEQRQRVGAYDEPS